MYKVMTLLKRRAGMPVEEFQMYWRERHAPLAASTPHVRRYVQSHPLVQGYRKGDLVFDGISEMWFDDRAAFEASRRDEAFARRLKADLMEFTSPASTVEMPVEVKVFVDGPIPDDGVKNIEFINRRPGMDLHAFRAYWAGGHGTLVSGIESMRRYEQNHLCLHEYDGGRQPAYDGLAVTWFDSTAGMKQSTSTEVYQRVRADEVNFLLDHRLPFMITREHVVVA
jgi:uncharacterized protein (TIGR02118 family)